MSTRNRSHAQLLLNGATGPWRSMLRARQRIQTIYRIEIWVRGKSLIKEYSSEDIWRTWREVYAREVAAGNIEHMAWEIATREDYR